MAARTKKPNVDQTYNALYDTLTSLSRLFGGSVISGTTSDITISIPGFGDRTYTVDKNDGTLLVTTEEYTRKGTPRRETHRTYIEEPIAFLLEYTSTNDNFKDVWERIEEYASRELR